MAQIVTTGARVLPAKPLVLGYRFRYPELDEALAQRSPERTAALGTVSRPSAAQAPSKAR